MTLYICDAARELNNPFGSTDAMIVNGKLVVNPQFEWTGGWVRINSRRPDSLAKMIYEGKAFSPDPKSIFSFTTKHGSWDGLGERSNPLSYAGLNKMACFKEMNQELSPFFVSLFVSLVNN